MKSSLRNIKSKVKKLLFSLDYLPRWMVFFMDVFLTIISSEVSYLIVRSLRVRFYDTLDVPTRYGIVVLINVIFVILSPPKPAKPKLATRRRLIDATARLFAEHGYNGLTMRSVAQEADANLAAANYHFGSKDALVLEL